jgi:hypothetical protein
MAELKTIVVSIMSPGVGRGGGGFVIINGRLRRVPPKSPKLKELEAASNLLAQIDEIADKKVRQQLNTIAESLIAANAEALVAEIGK